MANRILCSSITCPKCGTWIVVEREIRSRAKQGKSKTTCGVPECGKEFVFEDRETRVFELPHSIFEHRHFYRSEFEIRDCGVDRIGRPLSRSCSSAKTNP